MTEERRGTSGQSLGAVRTVVVHGPDSDLHHVLRTCMRIASSDATVLLTGETGTGKEVFARVIHERSGRAGRSMVSVNCGAIPEALLESELFGYVRGAFTGATASRRGRIALAEGGTLFLDEIGELPLSLQVKLLRVLQERTYEPVGSAEAVPANFRLVAATNRNLAQDVEAGRFRRDLYYRLLVCPLEIPPLRQRRGDITLLFQHFWRTRGEARPVEPAVFQVLEVYEWPGNVRELENLVERLSVCIEGPVIREGDLPVPFRMTAAGQARPVPEASSSSAAPPVVESVSSPAVLTPAEPLAPAARPSELAAPTQTTPDEPVYVAVDPTPDLPASQTRAVSLPVSLPRLLQRLEDAYIDAAIEQAGGNKKAAAELLGLQRTTLVEKLRRRNRDASQR
jgi:sigma-54 specific flagellar transcriptional regulator A